MKSIKYEIEIEIKLNANLICGIIVAVQLSTKNQFGAREITNVVHEFIWNQLKHLRFQL